MKEIKIIEMIISNFKGIKSLKLDFKNKQTNIYGANGTGKTSIADAFFWLLFDKDSNNRSSFLIRPQDENGNEIIEPTIMVEATLEVDGNIIKLKKEQNKKIQNKRGIEQVIAGNETSYTYNEVPTTATQYKKNVAEIIDEETFKVITNPLYFNKNVDWKKQRETLLDISGSTITDDDILASDNAFNELITEKGTHSIDDYKKILTDSKQKTTQELKEIPARIDELTKQINEIKDKTQIENKISELETKIKQLEDEAKDYNKQENEYKELLQKKMNLDSDLFDTNNKIILKRKALQANANNGAELKKEKVTSLDNEIKRQAERYTTLEKEISSMNIELDGLTKERARLREEFLTVKAMKFEFDSNSCLCPVTQKPCLEISELSKDKMEKDFIEKQNNQLLLIKEKGEVAAKEIESKKNAIEDSTKQMDEIAAKGKQLRIDLESAKEELNNISLDEVTDTPEILELIENINNMQKELLEVTKQINSIQKAENTNKNETEINELKEELKANQLELVKIQSAESVKSRIEELREQMKKGQEILDHIDKLLYDIESFIKAKIKLLELSINNKFKLVKFKLFQTQENGGIKECCIAMVNGVEFNDVNTANKINAGIDIINTLCKYYDISAPIIIDNRESVTNLVDTESQLINLIVSSIDTELRVE